MTFEQWLDVYEVAYRSAGEPFDIACPECGHLRLRLVYTAKPGADVGYGTFWCEHCLTGIGISRAVIPGWAVVRDGSLPAAERTPRIPDFRLVS
ncbi:hypothetical protein [Actinoplanes couchii]|uniref:Uncharacterized protein n=1 Tax=Actinoplanes couchii TaxID=403638 RepID=A0ABQ3XFD7_9ACTN|nr:hypothetical protein [Actinoplanes couchii]MDR6321825.1 hypothetical protein [Actinoplanes couchii]GID57219.1 hypothetical protein Aco03nite_056230 [Actinoplanes couchii]